MTQFDLLSAVQPAALIGGGITLTTGGSLGGLEPWRDGVPERDEAVGEFALKFKRAVFDFSAAAERGF